MQARHRIFRPCRTLQEEGHIQKYTNYPNDVLNYSNKIKNRLHSTQKPIGLLEYLIKTYTNEGETVLDNCMGSGSTAIACINTNRKFIGFETDVAYYNLANERIKNHVNNTINT